MYVRIYLLVDMLTKIKKSQMHSLRKFTFPAVLVGLVVLIGTQVRLAEAREGLKAIARFNHALFRLQEQPHCTAFQTRQGTIVTSLACLPNAEKALSHILFAYDRGDFYRHVFAQTTLYRTSQSYGIAVLCGNARPNVGFSVSSDTADAFGDVVIKGYGVPQKHVVRDFQCKLFADESGTLQLGECNLPPGLSGAPVILSDTDTVVGVITSVGNTHSRIVSLTSEAINGLCEANVVTGMRLD